MDHVALGAYSTPKGRDPLFRLAREDRRQHVYAVGKTGLGKSTLLSNVLLQDVAAGEGLALLDPHGDLALEVLDQIPVERMDDVVYFNPADRQHPAGLNILQTRSDDEAHLVVSGVVSALKHVWRDSWGPRLEYILANSLSTLVEQGNSTLLGVLRLLSDADYRERVTARVRDPVLRGFWEREFAAYDDRFRAEAVAPIQNKLGRLLSTPLLRNILGQVTSTIDLDEIMAERKILIANLSKGQVGEDNANLLGSLLVSELQLAALRRAAIPEEKRTDFYCFIDEFQSFGTDAFGSILSEARKYRLSLFLAHQYLDQVPRELRDAILGNVGTLMVFGVSAQDAELLEPALPIPARNLVDLGKYEVWVRLLRGGVGGQPFLGKTLAPADPTGGRRAAVVRQSRRNHTRKRTSVEQRINRWLEAT